MLLLMQHSDLYMQQMNIKSITMYAMQSGHLENTYSIGVHLSILIFAYMA
jgi:hypothetical protein